MLSLVDMSYCFPFRVKNIAGSPQFRKRVYEMGVTEGAEITKLRSAPLGDPIEVKVRNYYLSLRLEDARQIFVE